MFATSLQINPLTLRKFDILSLFCALRLFFWLINSLIVFKFLVKLLPNVQLLYKARFFTITAGEHVWAATLLVAFLPEGGRRYTFGGLLLSGWQHWQLLRLGFLLNERAAESNLNCALTLATARALLVVGEHVTARLVIHTTCRLILGGWLRHWCLLLLGLEGCLERRLTATFLFLFFNMKLLCFYGFGHCIFKLLKLIVVDHFICTAILFDMLLFRNTTFIYFQLLCCFLLSHALLLLVIFFQLLSLDRHLIIIQHA